MCLYYIYSPDLKKLSSQEELLLHLTSFGTCKCGLRCPFQFEDQFNFDPMILSLPAHIEHAQDTSSHCKVDHKFWETSASAKKSPSLKPSKAAIPLMFKHSNYMRPLVGQPVNYSLKNQSVLGKRALSSLSASRVDAVKKLKVRSTTFGAPAEANESEGGSVVSISAVENVAAAVGKQSASSFSSSSQMKSLKSQSSAAAGTLASLLSGPSDSGPCILTVTSEKPVSIPQPDSAISQETPLDLLKVSQTLEKVDQASSPSNTDDGVSSTQLIESQARQAISDDLCVSGKEAESADGFEKMSKDSSSSVEHLDDRRSISVDDDLLDTSHEQMEEGLPTPPVEGLEEPSNVSATDVPAGQQVDERDHSVSVVEDMEDTKAKIQGADLKDEGPDLNEAPDLKIEAPELNIEGLDLKIERPDLKNEAPDLKIEAPDLNIERLDLKIERPDLKNEEKNTDLMLNIEEPDLKNEEPKLEEPALKSKELDDCISTTPDNSTSLTPCLPTTVTPDSECNDEAPTGYHQPTQEDSNKDVPLSEPSCLMPTSETCTSEHSEYNDKAPTGYHQPTQEDSNKDVPLSEPSGLMPTSQTCTSDPSVFQSRPQTSEISPSVPVSSEPATASETERVENVSPPKEMNEESTSLTCAQTDVANDNAHRSPLSPQVLVPPSSVPIEAEEPRHFDAPSSEATSVLTSAAVESLKVDPSSTGVGNSLTTDSSLKVIKHVEKSKSIPDSESPIKQTIQSSYSLRSRSVPPTSSSPAPSTSKSCVTLRPFHIPLSHFRDLSSRKRTSVDLESANGAEILSISPLKRIKLELIDIVACDLKSSKQEMTATTGSADTGSLFPVSGTQQQGLNGDGMTLKQEDIDSMENEGTPRVKELQKEELNDGSYDETQIQGKLLDSSTDEATTDAQMEMDPNPDSEVDAASESIEQLQTAVITPQETSIDEPSNTDATSTNEATVSYSEGECGHNELVSSQVGAVDGTEIDVIDIQPQARETPEKGNVQEHTATSAAPEIAEPSDDIRKDFSSHEQIIDKSQSQIVPPLNEPALVVNPAPEELISTELPVLETASLDSPQASAQPEAKDLTNTQGVYETETSFDDSEAILQPNSESVEMPPTDNPTDCGQVHSTLPEARSEASGTMEPKTATIEEDVSIGPSEDLPTATAPSYTTETIMKLEIVEEQTPEKFQPEACQSSPPKVNIKSEPLQEIEDTSASVWDTIATINEATSDCSSIHDIEPLLGKQEEPDGAHPAQTKLEPTSMIPQQEAAITLLDEIHEAVVAMELRPLHTQLGATSFEDDSLSNTDTPVDSFQRQHLPLHTQSSVTPVDSDQEFQKQHLILQAQANKLMEDAPASLNVADLISCFQDNELFSSVPKRSPSAGSGKSSGPTIKQYDYTSVGLSSSSCLESSDTTAAVEDRLLATVDVSVDDSAKQVLPHSPGEIEPQLHGQCTAPGILKGSRDTIMTPKANPLPFVEESVVADATLQKLNSFLEDLKPQDSCATENPAQSHSEMHAQCMTFEPQLEPFAGDENEALNSTIATTSAPIESATSVPKPAFSINATLDNDDRSSLQGEITKEVLNISSSNASETLTSSDEMQTAFGVVTTTETATKDFHLHGE